MKFLLDENADIRIADYLRAYGHDVQVFALEHAAGSSDDEVLEVAHLEERILVTNDLDFGNLVFRKGLPHTGVILSDSVLSISMRSYSGSTAFSVITVIDWAISWLLVNEV